MTSRKPAKKAFKKGASAVRQTARPPADTRRTAPPPADSAADSKPAAAVTATWRSEGQRQLAGVLVGASLSEVAGKVGCSSRQTVADWGKGEKVPGAAYRPRLKEAYGIPAEAWERPPADGRSAPPTPRPSSSAPSGALRTTLEQCLTLIDDTEAELEADRAARKAQSDEGRLMPSERVKLRDTLARALSLRHRLESAGELLEDRVVRQHPTWKRLKGCVLKALVPYPDAARAVAAALQELGE